MNDRSPATFARWARVALRRTAKAAVFAVNGVWAVPAVVIIRLLRPLVTVRIGSFIPVRIGHFIPDAAIFLARRDLKSATERTLDLFWLPKQTSNEQWSRMVRRQLYARRWVRYLAGYNKSLPGSAPHVLEMPSWSGYRGEFAPLRVSTARFEFTPDEDWRAKEWLARRGWREGERFVCLLVRDSAYLSADSLHLTAPSGHYSYHDYRDTDIDSYVAAVQALLDRGYWVIRMGKVVHKPLPLTHERVIDYPFAPDKDELLDIWLGVKCSLFVSTASGIDALVWVYGGPPLVYVNALALFACASPINNIWVPKHLRWKETGAFLTLREHCVHAYGLASEYEAAGITIHDLSPDEITAAVLEGEERRDGKWADTADNVARQERAWTILRSMPNFSKVHGDVHPEARFGCAWLKSMGDSFLD